MSRLSRRDAVALFFAQAVVFGVIDALAIARLDLALGFAIVLISTLPTALYAKYVLRLGQSSKLGWAEAGVFVVAFFVTSHFVPA